MGNSMKVDIVDDHVEDTISHTASVTRNQFRFQFKCSLHSSVIPVVPIPNIETTLLMKNNPELSCAISAHFPAHKHLVIEVQLRSARDVEKIAFLESIGVTVHGNVVRDRGTVYEQRKVFELSENLRIHVERPQDEPYLFDFTKFQVLPAGSSFDINVECIDCSIFYLKWSEGVLLVQPIMYEMQPFLLSSEFSDVSLVIEEQVLPAHKVMLASQSSVFAAMFATPMRESLENRVHIREIDVESMKIILRYLYTGVFIDSDDSQLWDIFNFARMYEITGLQELCTQRLLRLIDYGNAEIMLDYANRFQLEAVYQKALDLVMNRRTEMRERQNSKHNYV